MTKEERGLITKKYQDLHMNCAQCVLLSFQDLLGLTEEQCLGIGSGFGGGMRCGGVCGAVSGAIMVLGMLYPQTPEGGAQSKARISHLTVEFQRRFKEKFGDLRCQTLLKSKVEATEATPAAADLGLTNRCDVLIVTAVEILEEMRQEGK